LLSGCSTSGSSSSPSGSSRKTVDIKDVVLTNLSSDCADYSASYTAKVKDLKQNLGYVSQFEVSEDEKFCTVTSNDIPNYNFNDQTANWAEPIATQGIAFTIPRNPKLASAKTELSLLFYNAIMLNGVVLDELSNGCYKPDDAAADKDGNVANGCGLSVDWRLNPMGKVKFGTDSHNGHTQPGGLYHYHGNPNALFDPKETAQGSPVIGFAADGFPIYGPHYIDSKTGKMLTAKSGYTLKSGERPTGDSSPGGSYDGTYIEDYEFTNSGSLDECNGMTVNGHYGYYVTDSYPYVMGCLSGTPNQSFFKFWNVVPWAIGGIAGLLAVITALTIWFVRRRRIKSRKVLQTHNEQSLVNLSHSSKVSR
jgi:hypothetical protein